MKVAVTGSTGFIGKELLKLLLARGDDVRILSRRPSAALQLPDGVAVHQLDLTAADSNSLIAFVDGVDVLYHAAGQLTSPAEMHALHVEGTKRLLDASAGRIGRWVQLSSVGAYGYVDNAIVNEDTPLNPLGPYECSKVKSDQLVEHYSRATALEYCILRPSNVFGPTMTNQSLLQLIDAINRRIFFYIGPPGASANYIPVENVADALVRCGTMTQAKGNIFNVSDYRSLEAFVAEIAYSLGVPSPRLRIPEAPVRHIVKVFSRFTVMPLTNNRLNALVSRCKYATDRIERELNYSPRISVEDAIHNLVRRCKCLHGSRSA
jgi:nucleoside-diphosphate-sugar epimerase